MTVEQLFLVVTSQVMGFVWGTLMIAAMICLVGMIAGQNWWSPVLHGWWRFCIVWPIQTTARLLATLFGAIAGGNQGGGRRRRRRRHDDDDE